MEIKTERAQWLAGFGEHLSARKNVVMAAWRECVDRDPALTAPDSLPRAQFNDHIPAILDAFANSLRCGLRRETPGEERDHRKQAEAHGLQRWQQGYNLKEVTLEWHYLQRCLLDELHQYSSAHGRADADVLHEAYRALTELCSEGVSESSAQYFSLRQAEAVGHVRDLQQTLDQMRELERARAELWHQVAHDLRGNIGVVANATAGISLGSVSESARERLFVLLQRNVTAVRSMLDDVMGLAKIQAGQERRQIATVDVARLLHEMCDTFEPVAQERGLYLRCDGELRFEVAGDATKIRRIAQNLVLNALRYTETGGVIVGFGPSRANDPERWMLTVLDTGPGFHAGPGAPIAKALEEATQGSKEIDRNAASDRHREFLPRDGSEGDSRPVHQERGEGIGLSIVKRLCDLLDASIELESKPNEGTQFRILFPRSYASGSKP
ncbi:MAG TPA: HAMP domain-containing sensor histidine kinase [Casimicrobiaceae bacterium]|nr:HAMP domain-containing sensor histidine kinase [Casimicrobiaceae bacterium]